MVKPIDQIELDAQAIAKSMDIVVFSFEGLFEKYVRENPTNQGLGIFWSKTGAMIEHNLNMIYGRIVESTITLEQTLNDSERSFLDAHTESDLLRQQAYSAIGAFLEQSRAAYAKRFRAIVAARAFGTDTYSADPRIMDRAGRTWNFSEFAYLTVRQLLVDWYNQVKIGYMAFGGFEKFLLDTTDPKLQEAIYEVVDYPALAPELFHPRTTKLVGEPYVST